MNSIDNRFIGSLHQAQDAFIIIVSNIPTFPRPCYFRPKLPPVSVMIRFDLVRNVFTNERACFSHQFADVFARQHHEVVDKMFQFIIFPTN